MIPSCSDFTSNCRRGRVSVPFCSWRCGTRRTDRILNGLNQVSTSSVVEGKGLPTRTSSDAAEVTTSLDSSPHRVIAVHYVLEESSGYMEPTLRILAILHTIISFFCIIGYYCLKVSPRLPVCLECLSGDSGAEVEFPSVAFCLGCSWDPHHWGRREKQAGVRGNNGLRAGE